MNRHRTHALMATAAVAIGVAGAAAAASTWSVVERWAGPDGSWDYVAFDPAHHRLYISRGDGVTAVDVETGKVTPRLLSITSTSNPPRAAASSPSRPSPTVSTAWPSPVTAAVM